MIRSLTSFIISLAIIFLCPNPTAAAAAGESKEYSWYCVRNKEHKVPLCDSNMSFIEDFDGFYVDKKAEEGQDRVIYLTFDAGYENGNIARILDVLKEENVPAAFFVLENIISKDPELILRMLDEGHLVCNHTSKHPNIAKFKSADELKAELGKLENAFYELTGSEMPKFFRPPEGRFSEQSMRFLKELGYKTIFWSFAYADWDNSSQMSAEKAKEKIFENIHNGEIMLLHPTSETNAGILGEVIRTLRAEGYRFGTLEELVAEK